LQRVAKRIILGSKLTKKIWRTKDIFLTAQQAKELDRRIISDFAMPSILLMENAGRAVAEEVIKEKVRSRRIAIFCGRGNNGADGLCAGRHLISQGFNPDIYLLGSCTQLKDEARVNLDILLRLKVKIQEVTSQNISLIKRRIKNYGIIIDALLGIGIKGEVSGLLAETINLINASKAYVIAVDIPSGLDATSGEVCGVAVKADKTVTFMAKKTGMIINKGKDLCGKIKLKDLGFPFPNQISL